MAKLDLLITLDESAELDAAAKSLEAQGLAVRRTYPRSNTIIGSGDSSLLESLKHVDGVEDVRQEGGYQLPDMNEETPQ